MSTLLTRPSSEPGPGSGPDSATAAPPAQPVPLAAALAAVWAAGLGLLPVALVVLLGWAAAADTAASAGEAVRASGQVWLLGHHAVIRLPSSGAPDGLVALAPMGLLALPALLLAAAGARAVRAADVTSPRTAARCLLTLSACYAVIAGAVAAAATTASVRPSVLSAVVGALLMSLLAGGFGVVREAGLLPRVIARLPDLGWHSGLAAVAAVAVLLAGGALLAGVAMAASADRVYDLTTALDTGRPGLALLTLLGLACVPNVAVWGLSYAVGPGFAVGAGTSVAPSGVTLGAVPAFPLLGGLPESGAAPAVAWLALAVPLLAGAVAGRVLLGAGPPNRRQAVAACATTGVLVGGAVLVLAALSGGALGGGRLSAVGPSPWQVGVAAGLEVGLVSAVPVLLGSRLRAAGRWTVRRAAP